MTESYKAGDFIKYKATRGFHIGEIAKSQRGVTSDIKEGETIEFDGEFCNFQGKKYRAPGLKGAIEAKWLVLNGSNYVKPATPIVRDEVSRPLGSTKSELQITFTGLKLEDYKFKAKFKDKQKMVLEIDNPEVLRAVLKQEKDAKVIPLLEERLVEVEAQIEKASHKSIGGAKAVDSGDMKGLMEALDDTQIVTKDRDKVYQTPQGKKVRKPMQRDAMEENQIRRPTAKAETVEKPVETKMRREYGMVDGEASSERSINKEKIQSKHVERKPKK